jgi:hypothetical protein
MRLFYNDGLKEPSDRAEKPRRNLGIGFPTQAVASRFGGCIQVSTNPSAVAGNPSNHRLGPHPTCGTLPAFQISFWNMVTRLCTLQLLASPCPFS